MSIENANEIFKHPFRVTIVGSSNAGKSYLLSELV